MFKGITHSSFACLSTMHMGGYFAACSGTFGLAKFSPLSAPNSAFSFLPLRFLSFKSWPGGENILRLCIQTLRGYWLFSWGKSHILHLKFFKFVGKIYRESHYLVTLCIPHGYYFLSVSLSIPTRGKMIGELTRSWIPAHNSIRTPFLLLTGLHFSLQSRRVLLDTQGFLLF